MGEDFDSQDGAIRWKQKYYTSLEQLEAKEKQWGEVENLLRRCITRLSLAADGADPALDSQIETLRNAIRDGRDSLGLRSMIDVIGDTVARLDQRNKANKGPAKPEPVEVLAQLLDKLNLPRGMNRRVKALRRNLLGAKEGLDITPLLHEFAALVQEGFSIIGEEQASNHTGTGPAPAPAAPAVTPDKGGLFGRLLARRGPAGSTTPGPESGPVVRQAPLLDVDPLACARELLLRLVDKLPPAINHAKRDQLKGRAADNSSQAELQQLIDELATLINEGRGDAPLVSPLPEPGAMPLQDGLIQLLEKLDFPADMAERTGALKQRLEAGIKNNELSEILEIIASLVAGVRARMQQERAEIENFLKQLTDRLREIDLFLQGAESSRGSTLQDGRALNAALQTQVSGIKQAVQSATELNQLKQVIEERVEAIHNHLDIYRRSEEERNLQAEQQLKLLNVRLQSMEDESNKLHARIQRERNQAMCDALTGIGNRLAYQERLDQEYARWKRYASPLSLLVWDVDRFKYINDTFGHKAGDKALVTIAEMLRDQIRETDFVARYGGEEFVILLPATGLDAAQTTAEKLRKSIEACHFHFREALVPITISCGIAEFHAGDTAESVFDRADAAMYRAKKAGGNHCMVEYV